MKIAIHQPNFIPHLPFFHKMEQADVFVFLTHCQYEKNNYQNRFQHNNNWNTCRVPKKPLSCKIIDKDYIDFEADFQKIINNHDNKDIRYSLESIYSTYDIMKRYHSRSNSLAEINITLIRSIYTQLFYGGILKSPLPTIAMDYETDLTKTERLIDIVKRHNGTTYLSGISGIKYMDMNQWYNNGIAVVPMSKPNEFDMVNSLTRLEKAFRNV